MRPQYTTIPLERLLRHIEKSVEPPGCWLWVGKLYPNGYGTAYLDHKHAQLAHRAVYEALHGPIPPGKVLCHRCDVRRCVNAECEVPGCEHLKDSPGCTSHLFPGTQADNLRDMIAKGRGPTFDQHGSHTHPERRPRGATHGRRKLSAEQVAEIYAMPDHSRVAIATLAARFAVQPRTIRRVLKGQTWAVITSDQS